MRHDLRFGLRTILSHRWFSAAVVVTLALGIGLNTMVFTLINAALFKPVPLPNGERLVAVGGRNMAEDNHGLWISYPDFRDYRAQQTSLETFEAGANEGAVLAEPGNPPQPFRMSRITSGLFNMLRMRPVLGREFLSSDDKAGAEPVLLIGYGVWKDRYGSSPSVIGRHVRVNEKPATIVGVMPEGFHFPNNEDLWMPLVPTPDLEKRANHALVPFALLKPGVSIAQAQSDLSRIAARLAAEYPDDKGMGVVVDDFHEHYNGGPIKRVFILMLAAVGFVLLIACANVANMMLSRALGRQREISIRAALGASRWRVVRQLLVESVLLSALGGVLGLGLSVLGISWFDLATQDVGKPYWVQFTMDYVVFAYFAGLCILTGFLFGLVPALRSSRVDLNSALKEGTRSAGTRRGGKLASLLVAAQFALTLVLLTGAGIFVRGFLQGLAINPTVPADHLLTAVVRLPKEHYADAAARLRFFQQLHSRIQAIPDVTSDGIASDLPGTGDTDRHIEVETTRLADPAHGPSAAFVLQSPGYFSTINLPLLLGRDFNETDGAPGRLSAIVTKEFKERYWPNAPAIGKRFRIYDKDKPTPEWISVIGVSANIVQNVSDTSHNPVFFLPYRQEAWDGMFVVLRTTGNPTSAAFALRAAVQGLDQDLPLFDVKTLTEAVEHQQWFLRVFGTLFSVFALIALAMASVGIYAVIAQATSRRTQEIGVRMALGATSRNILGLILKRGFIQLSIGLAIGLAVAFPATRLMAKLPFQGSQSNVVLLLALSLLLGAIGIFACWLPARRAATLDPLKAIRYE